MHTVLKVFLGLVLLALAASFGNLVKSEGDHRTTTINIDNVIVVRAEDELYKVKYRFVNAEGLITVVDALVKCKPVEDWVPMSNETYDKSGMLIRLNEIKTTLESAKRMISERTTDQYPGPRSFMPLKRMGIMMGKSLCGVIRRPGM